MNLEGEYAMPKYFKAERRFCILILLIFFAFYTYLVGIGLSMRVMASFIVPTVLIWNADALADKKTDGCEGWLRMTNSHLYARVVGWFMILLFIGLRLLPFIMR